MRNFNFNYSDPYTVSGDYDFLSEKNKDLLGMTGFELAEDFGFKNPEDYAEFFNRVDTSEYDEIIDSMPELLRQKRNVTRNEYIDARGQLQSEMGSAGFASTGGYDAKLNKLDYGFGEKMRGVDEWAAELIGGVQQGLLGQFGDIYGTAQNLFGGGAELE